MAAATSTIISLAIEDAQSCGDIIDPKTINPVVSPTVPTKEELSSEPLCCARISVWPWVWQSNDNHISDMPRGGSFGPENKFV